MLIRPTPRHLGTTSPQTGGASVSSQDPPSLRQGNELPDDSQKLPRKQRDIVPPDVGQSLPTPEETRPGAQEISPRKRDKRVPDDSQKLPRKQRDIAPPDVDQSLLTAGNEEDANQPSNTEKERVPRKKD